MPKIIRFKDVDDKIRYVRAVAKNGISVTEHRKNARVFDTRDEIHNVINILARRGASEFTVIEK